jgi:hypothetical protein
MWRVIGVAVALALGTVLVVAVVSFGGCEKRPDPWQPAEDELSGEAAAMPPNTVTVRLTRQPDAPPAGATEVRYEWAILASLQEDKLPAVVRRDAAGKSGWTVLRYALTVKPVTADDLRAVPQKDRVQPKPGTAFVRHEGELRWATVFPQAVNGHGTAGFAYHVPGTAKPIRVFATAPERVTAAADPAAAGPRHGASIDIFKPWTYSVEARAGPLADVVTPVLTGETTVELPAKVDLLRVGDVVTSLDLRP